jgi:hypothetical protein
VRAETRVGAVLDQGDGPASGGEHGGTQGPDQPGIEAIRSVSEELVERVLKEGIEMRGRMVHKKAKRCVPRRGSARYSIRVTVQPREASMAAHKVPTSPAPTH